MKNLLLLLLLANILYFVWGWVADNGNEPGIVVVDESDLGPPLAVSAPRDAPEAASVGAVLGVSGFSILVYMSYLRLALDETIGTRPLLFLGIVLLLNFVSATLEGEPKDPG